MSNNRARDLLKAAKLKKLQTISEPIEYKVEDALDNGLEETGNSSTDKTSSDEVNKENVIQERDEQKQLIKEKLALFDKIKKEPQMFRGGSFFGFKKQENIQEPKKLVAFTNHQKELKDFIEEKDVKETLPKQDEKEVKDRLMKRISSAKMQKPKKEQNVKVLGFADMLESKFKQATAEHRKKFILEDSDIQKIDTEVSKVVIEDKKDIIEILMEKPVVKVKKMARKEFIL
jgi:hypothetical protein